MARIDLSSRELSMILAALEYWTDSHEDDDPYDQMSEDLEQATFGETGQPRNNLSSIRVDEPPDLKAKLFVPSEQSIHLVFVV